MLERWNPTVKAFTVLICVILLSFEYLVSLNLLVLAVCLLLLMFCSRVSLKKIGVILLPACIAAFGLFVTGLYYARGGSTQTMDLSSLSAMPYSVRAAMSQNLYTALQLATRLLAYAGLGILRPFIHSSKGGIARMGQELGVDFSRTYSCYKGGRIHCGTCSTCLERREAFREAGIPDPTVYADQ